MSDLQCRMDYINKKNKWKNISMNISGNSSPNIILTMNHLVFLIVFLFIPTNLMAEEYRSVFANPRQINLIEVTSIKDKGGSIFEAWLISIREKNSFLGGKVSQAKFLSEINCNNKTERVITSVFYGKDGIEMSRKETPEKDSHPWVPDTASTAEGNFICDPKSRDSKFSFGDMPLKDIIKSIYDGPWPVNK